MSRDGLAGPGRALEDAARGAGVPVAVALQQGVPVAASPAAG
ncbi:hypothetical protein AB0J63_18500 [Streptosporangium canum]